jgi:hypothetical protein
MGSLKSQQYISDMLFYKIINRVFLILEIILSIFLLIGWTLSYPLLRLRFAETKRGNHRPSVVLFKLFLWASKTFDFHYPKK